MTVPLLTAFGPILAVAVVAGGVAAVGLRDARAATLGLLIAQVGSPFLADPLPDPRGIVARIAGAALVAYLLLMAVRDAPGEPDRPAMGWPASLLAAVTAGMAVIAASGAVSSGAASTPGSGLTDGAGAYVPAAAAGAALAVLAAAPITLAASPLRLAIGLLLGATSVTLLVSGLSGPPSALVNWCVAVLLGALAGAGGLLHRIGHRTDHQLGTQPVRR